MFVNAANYKYGQFYSSRTDKLYTIKLLLHKWYFYQTYLVGIQFQSSTKSELAIIQVPTVITPANSLAKSTVSWSKVHPARLTRSACDQSWRISWIMIRFRSKWCVVSLTTRRLNNGTFHYLFHRLFVMNYYLQRILHHVQSQLYFLLKVLRYRQLTFSLY